MDILFFSPAYPPEMNQCTRGLAEVGARVWGVGDSALESIPAETRRHLAGYLQVSAILDEEDVYRRVLAWVGDRKLDRIESNWEVTQLLAARLREALGIPGMSVDVVRGFRDKPLMRERVAAAGLRVPQTRRAHTRSEVWAAAEAIGYPVVVKPVAGAGSADTFFLDKPGMMDPALDQIRHVPEVSVEEAIVGEELTYETLCVDGVPVYESVSLYLPNCLVARQNEWVSPVILSVRDLTAPWIQPGLELGRRVLGALGMGTGFTHMEWFRKPDGEAVFGEIACRAPGANMVDLMNYTSDIDLFREWARVVCWHRFEVDATRKYNAAIIFKRAQGAGTIRGYAGLDTFLHKYGAHVARVDLLPVGAPRRDWRQTFLSDGNLVVRHPDWDTARRMAMVAAEQIQVYAG